MKDKVTRPSTLSGQEVTGAGGAPKMPVGM
jgi:hypothetical protein